MNLLALETTCDETAAAILTDRLDVLASVVASQDELHRRFGGVVPEIASRAHLERILPVIDEALRKSGLKLSDIDAVAVANTPGLAGSLLVGLVAAKSICLARGLPLIAVNHLQAHVYACRVAAGRDVFPCVGLIVSGGHSSLYRCRTAIDFEFLGGTIDDAAGEAFDKVASMLGLPYPGGPSLQRASAGGNPRAYAFPRPLLRDERIEFSFSGLKTAVRYAIERELASRSQRTEVGDRGRGTSVPGAPTIPTVPSGPNGGALPPETIADLAASFQEAVVDCLVGKSVAALQQTGAGALCVGGGVAANARLRQRLQEEADRRQFELHIAPLRLCTDNAVMGAIAVERWRAGLFESLDLDAFPGVVRNASPSARSA
ncbi:MAG: tRNA (adenosine(37)-N6)-threonylcarbamoyltransferase complex transferase subunit TsaD [Thermoguttaceae bacterium]